MRAVGRALALLSSGIIHHSVPTTMNSTSFLPPETTALLRRAHQIALHKRHAQLEVEHVLLALLDEPGGIAGRIIERLGGDPRQLAQQLDDDLKPSPQLMLD